MKICYVFLLLLLVSCRLEKEEAMVTSTVNCIVPLVIPETHFAKEDSITVTPILQLR